MFESCLSAFYPICFGHMLQTLSGYTRAEVVLILRTNLTDGMGGVGTVCMLSADALVFDTCTVNSRARRDKQQQVVRKVCKVTGPRE